MRWKFYVVPESDLPGQKTIGLQAVQGLTSRCGIGASGLWSKHLRAPPLNLGQVLTGRVSRYSDRAKELSPVQSSPRSVDRWDLYVLDSSPDRRGSVTTSGDSLSRHEPASGCAIRNRSVLRPARSNGH